VELVKNSKGFSGAEIEEAVVTGLYSAFNHSRDLTTEDVLKAIKETNPLSRSKAKELEQMSLWAESNAVNASKEEKQTVRTPVSAGRQLEI
jgi:SpoVK/Ycf46/Vps4 family AAA+-type ATPase